MDEPQLERLHAAATLFEKRTELVEQRRAGYVEVRRVRDLGFQIAPCCEPFARDEILARIRLSADRTIDHVEHVWLEPPCKTVARQAQAITNGPHAHRGEHL